MSAYRRCIAHYAPWGKVGLLWVLGYSGATYIMGCGAAVALLWDVELLWYGGAIMGCGLRRGYYGVWGCGGAIMGRGVL